MNTVTMTMSAVSFSQRKGDAGMVELIQDHDLNTSRWAGNDPVHVESGPVTLRAAESGIIPIVLVA